MCFGSRLKQTERPKKVKDVKGCRERKNVVVERVPI